MIILHANSHLHTKLCLKGTVHPKIKSIYCIYYFPLSFSAIYLSRLFWCELEISDFFSNVKGVNGALNVVVNAKKKTQNI